MVSELKLQDQPVELIDNYIQDPIKNLLKNVFE